MSTDGSVMAAATVAVSSIGEVPKGVVPSTSAEVASSVVPSVEDPSSKGVSSFSSIEVPEAQGICGLMFITELLGGSTASGSAVAKAATGVLGGGSLDGEARIGLLLEPMIDELVEGGGSPTRRACIGPTSDIFEVPSCGPP